MTDSAVPFPLVSAVIPVYNGERYLGEAIQSVLSQDYPNLELVVIDDGSSDGSAQIAQSFAGVAGHALKYHYQDNAGLSAAQNAGVEQASGEFIAFLDCDDLWSPGKISLQMSAFSKQPGLDMVFGYVEQFLSPELAHRAPGEAPKIADVMPGYSTGTMLARREIFTKAGLFSSEFRLGEFVDWYARATDAGATSVMLTPVLLRRRIHKHNMGIRDRDKRSDYLRVFKASLERRRQAKSVEGQAVRPADASTECNALDGLLRAAHGGDSATIVAALQSSRIGLEELHEIRQRYHRQRQVKLPAKALANPASRQWLSELQTNGIVRLPGFVGKDDLQQMRADFQGFIGALNQKILRRESLHQSYDEEESFWPKDRAYISNNAFKYSQCLVNWCRRDALLELVRAYIGIKPMISRGVAMRYLPDKEKHSDMFGWHHDMEDQRLKVLILLTDVGKDDQNMSYLRGSHVLYHPLQMFHQNECSPDYCRQQLGSSEIIHATGLSGDVFLFDSNGAHRGNRRPGGAVRDTFFIEFTTDPSDVWGGDLPGNPDDRSLESNHDPFTGFKVAEKKWNHPLARTAPAWVENLPDVARWL
jgi:glycosyltransferase involved in cell wall biosynthesis